MLSVPQVLIISQLNVFRLPGEEIDELVHYDHSFNEVGCFSEYVIFSQNLNFQVMMRLLGILKP